MPSSGVPGVMICLAVLGGADLDVLDLIAAVVAGDHVLAAGLIPLHRPTEMAGELHGEDLLAIQLQFAAESAADVRGDDAQRVLRHPRHEREEHPKHVGDLGRRPYGHLIAHAHRGGDDRARLHVAGDDALVDEAALHHDIGLGLGLVVGDPGAGQREGVALVGHRGALAIVDERRARLQRGLHVDHRGERLVVDLDGLECVIGRGLIGREDHCDAVADVADLVHREGGERRHLDVVGHRPHAGDRAIEVAELGGAIGRHDVRLIQGTGDVELGDLGVGHRATQDGHVQRVSVTSFLPSPQPRAARTSRCCGSRCSGTGCRASLHVSLPQWGWGSR